MEGSVNTSQSESERQSGLSADFGRLVETSLQQLIVERGLAGGRSGVIELNNLSLDLPAHTDLEHGARATAAALYRIFLQKA